MLKVSLRPRFSLCKMGTHFSVLLQGRKASLVSVYREGCILKEVGQVFVILQCCKTQSVMKF